MTTPLTVKALYDNKPTFSAYGTGNKGLLLVPFPAIRKISDTVNTRAPRLFGTILVTCEGNVAEFVAGLPSTPLPMVPQGRRSSIRRSQWRRKYGSNDMS